MCVWESAANPEASHPDDPAVLTLYIGGKNASSIHPLLQATFSKYIPVPPQNKPIKKNTNFHRSSEISIIRTPQIQTWLSLMND